MVIAKSHFGFLPAFPSSMNLSCLSMCPYFALFSMLLSFCSPARHQLPLQLWQLLSLQSFEDSVPTQLFAQKELAVVLCPWLYSQVVFLPPFLQHKSLLVWVDLSLFANMKCHLHFDFSIGVQIFFRRRKF